MGHIVVGVDESTESAAALRWAADEAHRRDCRLTAVLAWEYLSQHHGDASARGFDPSYGEADALAALDACVTSALGPAGAAAVERKVVCDLPAHALVDAAHGADLLVVGTGDEGGLRRALHGSVSRRCTRCSPCPVVVVGADGQARTVPDGRTTTPVG